MASYKSIVISSGHGKYVRGASGIIDEVDEARKVVEQLAKDLRARGIKITTFHDDTSHDQNTNLHTIVDFHNKQTRDLDISVHFNAYVETTSPRGCEVLYVTQSSLASRLSAAIASVGFTNRGGKYNSGLYFLNQTIMPSVLLEICFVDSQADCDVYADHFSGICTALADELAGKPVQIPEFIVSGKVSHFGGPDDMGVSPSEGLAFIYSLTDKPVLFLSYQPTGTTGLARRLNSDVPYIACRWPYDAQTKSAWREVLLREMALVYAPSTDKQIKCYPADWGPHEDTGRVADISPGAMEYLNITTDDLVEVEFPFTHRGEV